MFQVDDYVVYRNSGVCKILEIGTPEFLGANNTELYYSLQPVFTKASLIYTPIKNQESLRKIISKEDAMKLVDDIANIETIEVQNDKLREAVYKDIMKKNDCREWIKIIKTIYLKKQQKIAEGKKIGNIEQKYLFAAEDNLFSELSVALEIPKDRMEDYISAKVNHSRMTC